MSQRDRAARRWLMRWGGGRQPASAARPRQIASAPSRSTENFLCGTARFPCSFPWIVQLEQESTLAGFNTSQKPVTPLESKALKRLFRMTAWFRPPFPRSVT